MQPKPYAVTFLWLMQSMGLEKQYRGSGTCFACDQPEFDPGATHGPLNTGLGVISEQRSRNKP